MLLFYFLLLLLDIDFYSIAIVCLFLHPNRFNNRIIIDASFLTFYRGGWKVEWKEYRNKGCQSRCRNYTILSTKLYDTTKSPSVIIYFVSTPAAAIIADRLTLGSSIGKTDTPRSLSRNEIATSHELRSYIYIYIYIHALFSSPSPPKKSRATSKATRYTGLTSGLNLLLV